MRIYDGDITLGEFHGHPNYMEKAGDETDLHFHDYDHLVIPFGKIEVWAKLPNGEERIVPMTRAEFRLIRAGVQHRIRALEDNVFFVCLFARWGPDGYRADPKRWTGNPRSSVNGTGDRL